MMQQPVPDGVQDIPADSVVTVEGADGRIDAPLEDPAYYLNRELSQLAFFWRVLEEARDPLNPLLERLKFLSIVCSNLDEFFMVRVVGLRRQVDAGVTELTPDGMSPAEQLAAIRKAGLRLMVAATDTFGALLRELDAAGIHLLDYDALKPSQQAVVKEYFESVVFP